MSEADKDYELKVLKLMLNTYLDEIVSVTTEEGLKSLEANRDQTVWKLATKVYSQSGHKVDLYTVRDLVDFRIEVMKYQVAADKERMRERIAADKERMAEEARQKDALKANIPARVQKIVSEQLQVDESKVKLNSHLVDDLGMDELDWVELLMALEKEFDIEIPDGVIEDGLGVFYTFNWSSISSNSSSSSLHGKVGADCTVKNLVNLVQKILSA